jgi:hypothetical protein
VTGPFTLGGPPRVQCVHCAAMLWPCECSTVFSVDVSNCCSTEIDPIIRPISVNGEYEVEAIVGRRIIPGQHCFYNRDQQAPLRKLTQACQAHMDGVVRVQLHC